MNQELLYKAATYCSGSEHCISEVQTKLTAWGAEPEEVQPIIDYLLQEKYIDEDRYCRAYVNDKLRFAKWGRIKIRYMLQVKHLNQSAIQDALCAIDDEQYQKILADLLRVKIKSLRSVDPQQRNLKLIRFAASRGFEPNIISQVIKQI